MTARKLAFQQTMVAAQPMANCAGRFQRRAKAEFGQPVQCLVVIGMRWKCQDGHVGSRRSFKQASVVTLNLVQVAEQNGGEGVTIGETEETGKTLKISFFGGQCLRLFVVHHLQAMFDQTQKTIGLLHCLACIRINPFVFAKLIKRCESVAIAQTWIAATCDQLLGLGKELDLTDAAAAELYVVSLTRNLAMSAIGVDLPLHRMNIFDRGKIEIFTPDKRGEIAEDFFSGNGVTGTRARLYQSGAFPVLSRAFIVGQSCRGRYRNGR